MEHGKGAGSHLSAGRDSVDRGFEATDERGRRSTAANPRAQEYNYIAARPVQGGKNEREKALRAVRNAVDQSPSITGRSRKVTVSIVKAPEAQRVHQESMSVRDQMTDWLGDDDLGAPILNLQWNPRASIRSRGRYLVQWEEGSGRFFSSNVSRCFGRSAETVAELRSMLFGDAVS